MKNLNKFSISLVLFLSVIFACSTTPKTSRIQAASDFPPNASGAIFVFKLDSGAIVSEGGCSLSLAKRDTLKTFDIDFLPGQGLIFAELPPGIYSYKQINCGSTHWDEQFNPYPAFQVFADKLSLAGELDFKVEGARNGHSNSSHFRNKDALALLKNIPVTEKNLVFSGYTGKPIPSEMLNSSENYKKWELKSANGSEIKLSKKAWPKFHECYVAESAINGIYLWDLKLTAHYENGNWVETKISDSPHTFTDKFVECVKTTLQNYHPFIQNSIDYTISL